jgi:hypothetical protein
MASIERPVYHGRLCMIVSPDDLALTRRVDRHLLEDSAVVK